MPRKRGKPSRGPRFPIESSDEEEGPPNTRHGAFHRIEDSDPSNSQGSPSNTHGNPATIQDNPSTTQGNTSNPHGTSPSTEGDLSITEENTTSSPPQPRSRNPLRRIRPSPLLREGPLITQQANNSPNRTISTTVEVTTQPTQAQPKETSTRRSKFAAAAMRVFHRHFEPSAEEGRKVRSHSEPPLRERGRLFKRSIAGLKCDGKEENKGDYQGGDKSYDKGGEDEKVDEEGYEGDKSNYASLSPRIPHLRLPPPPPPPPAQSPPPHIPPLRFPPLGPSPPPPPRTSFRGYGLFGSWEQGVVATPYEAMTIGREPRIGPAGNQVDVNSPARGSGAGDAMGGDQPAGNQPTVYSPSRGSGAGNPQTWNQSIVYIPTWSSEVGNSQAGNQLAVYTPSRGSEAGQSQAVARASSNQPAAHTPTIGSGARHPSSSSEPLSPSPPLGPGASHIHPVAPTPSVPSHLMGSSTTPSQPPLPGAGYPYSTPRSPTLPRGSGSGNQALIHPTITYSSFVNPNRVSNPPVRNPPLRWPPSESRQNSTAMEYPVFYNSGIRRESLGSVFYATSESGEGDVGTGEGTWGRRQQQRTGDIQRQERDAGTGQPTGTQCYVVRTTEEPPMVRILWDQFEWILRVEDSVRGVKQLQTAVDPIDGETQGQGDATAEGQGPDDVAAAESTEQQMPYQGPQDEDGVPMTWAQVQMEYQIAVLERRWRAWMIRHDNDMIEREWRLRAARARLENEERERRLWGMEQGWKQEGEREARTREDEKKRRNWEDEEEGGGRSEADEEENVSGWQ
ncbi:hypothetical protein K470DRAFT_293788 [Piedraia hortae CBS 480.64]|uniref:Uncharacterized protein n=1 Tax=Piedraia hortae CBS 480.64 TaxID=1314780 RepID=A0A6A7C3K9_9PEZI|nr:hypothetical protein K470DRAFT_293788 [Piedraia hortae CBS 480.64]